MPKATDFRTIRCQVSVFTPEIDFRQAKIFRYLLTKYGDEFDGDPVSIPFEGLPAEIPQIILKSSDGILLLNASPNRLDLIREKDAISESSLEEFLGWSTELALSYLGDHHGKAGRVACVLQKAVDDESPAKTLSSHFCQERWGESPLDRPSEFQLHSMKKYRLGDLFEVNSWVRCKSAILIRTENQSTYSDVITVEQDLNSVNEPTGNQEKTTLEIKQFFSAALSEMHGVLKLYFPDKD